MSNKTIFQTANMSRFSDEPNPKAKIDEMNVTIPKSKIIKIWFLPFSICLIEIESIFEIESMRSPPMMCKQTCQRVQHHGMW